MALDHEEPDRCPMQVSFTPEFASRLRADLGLTDADVHNPHGGGNTYIFISTLKEINPEVKVAYHSDGMVVPIIPDLIEIGLDVLNPIQPRSMDPAALKREFGENLCFWGSMDEQHTLPFGTPTDVANEVTTRLRTLGRDGGLIIGPTHHVQLDTPLENFWAMVDTVTKTPCASPRPRNAASTHPVDGR
jgi:hypothetical protein